LLPPSFRVFISVDFEADVEMIPLNSIVEKAYKPKQRITYKLINECIIKNITLKSILYIAE